MADNFTPQPVKGRLTGNATAPTDDNVGALVAAATNLAPAYTEGTQVHLSTDLTGRLRVVLGDDTEGGALDVDVIDRQERILGLNRTDEDTRAYETARTDAQTDAIVANSTAEATATRDLLDTNLTTLIANNTDEFTATRDLLAGTRDTLVTTLTDQRDALLAGLESVSLNADTLTALTTANPYVRGAAVDDANPLPVVIQTNPGTVIDSGLLRSDNVAAGAEVALDSAPVAGASGRLLEFTVSSSVRLRVELQVSTGNGAPVVTPVRVFFVEANESYVYRSVDQDAIVAATGGLFRLVLTNMDNRLAANVYGSITHNEV